MGRRAKFRGATVLGLVVMAAAVGCGASKEDTAPAACLAKPDGYLSAVERAPAPVRLPGDVPISACLVPNQTGGQLASVGHSMVIAATRLNVAARHDPAGPAALQLGYLIGAVSKGADTIHVDLVRRLNSAAHFSEGGPPPASFERAFGRGYAAGHQSG